MTVKEFTDEHCKNCTEESCAVDSEPSCALSRTMGVKLESEDQ